MPPQPPFHHHSCIPEEWEEWKEREEREGRRRGGEEERGEKGDREEQVSGGVTKSSNNL